MIVGYLLLKENWSQAPKYPISLIRAGQRELYSASKFHFEIKEFWVCIFPYILIFLFSCFVSLNHYLKIVDLPNQAVEWNKMNSSVRFYQSFVYSFCFLLPFISNTLSLFHFSRKYKEEFYISGAAFYFIYLELSFLKQLIFPLIYLFNSSNKNLSDIIFRTNRYIDFFFNLFLFLPFLLTVKDVRRGWNLFFKLRSNHTKSNRLLNYPSHTIYRVPKNPLDQPYSHWIELDRRKKLFVVFALILIVSLVVIFAYQSGNWINQLLNLPNKNQQLIQDKKYSLTVVLSLIQILFLSPLIKELVFRHGLMNMANNGRLAMLTSTIIYGLFYGIFTLNPNRVISENWISHFGFVSGGILELWPYLLSGLVLAFSYRLTGNVWITVAAHFLNNLVFLIMV